MAVKVTAGTIAETNDTSNVTTHASGSFTPVANRLYLLAVSHSDTAPEATIPTIATTTGLVFVQVGSSIAYDTTGTNVHRLTLFRAMKSAGLSNGTYTVTLADADTGAASVLIEVTQVVTTGTDGADAVTNIATNAANAGANPSITMGAFASNNNGVAAFFGFDITTAATASNTGWAVIGDASYATPNTGLTALWTGANSGTATCVQGSSDWAGIAVELVSEAVPVIQPVQPPPPPKAKAALAAAILAGACFFNPLPIPTPDVIDGASGTQTAAGRISTTVVQYPGLTGPVLAQAAAPVVAPDLTADNPDPLIRARRRPRSETVAPVFVPDVTQAVTALSWTPDYPDRVVRLRAAPERAQAVAADRFEAPGTVATPDLVASTYPAALAARRAPDRPTAAVQPIYLADVTVAAPALSWRPQYATDPSLHVGRRAQQGQQPSAPAFVPDVTQPVAALSWEATYPDRLARPSGHALRPAAGVADPPANVAPPELGWQRIQPDAVVRAKRLVEAPPAVAPLYVADVTVPVPTRSWAPTYPDAARAVRVQPALHAAVFRDRFDAPGAVVTPDLSWQRAQPDALVRRRRLADAPQPTAPIFVPDATAPAPALAWKGTQPDRVPARLGLHAARQLAFAFDRFDPPGTIAVPALVAPVYPAAVGRTRVRPAGSVVAPPTVSPATEQWLPIAPSFVWRSAPPTPADSVAPIYVLDVTQPAPYGSWAPTYVDKVQPAVRLWWHLAAVQNVDPIAITVTAGAAPACRRLEAVALTRRLTASAIVRRLTPSAITRRQEPTGCHS